MCWACLRSQSAAHRLLSQSTGCSSFALRLSMHESLVHYNVRCTEYLRMLCMSITDSSQCNLSARVATAAGKHNVPLSHVHEEHCLYQGRIFCCRLWPLPGQPCDGAPFSRWEDRKSGAAALPCAFSKRLSTRTCCERTNWDDGFGRVCVPETAHSDCTAYAVESLWLPHWAAQTSQS